MDTIENDTVENEKTEEIFGCSDDESLHVKKLEKSIQIKRRISSNRKILQVLEDFF